MKVSKANLEVFQLIYSKQEHLSHKSLVNLCRMAPKINSKVSIEVTSMTWKQLARILHSFANLEALVIRVQQIMGNYSDFKLAGILWVDLKDLWLYVDKSKVEHLEEFKTQFSDNESFKNLEVNIWE